MSMVDDNSPVKFDEVTSDAPLDALEQAQFDAMRNGVDVPEALPDAPAEKKVETPADPPVDKKVETPVEEPDDPDVETVKDPKTGKEVLDERTGKPQKRVSFHKYQREEARRKQLEDELNVEREKNSRIDERLKIINEALATPQNEQQQKTAEEEDPEPNPETHIFEHNAWLKRQLVKTNDRLATFEQTQQTASEEVELGNNYRNAAAQFAATEPAFAQGYTYLIQQRLRELEEAGVSDPKKREAQVVREEKGLVSGALKQGKNPAAMLFNMAKLRGFVPKAAPDPKALDAGGEAAAAAAPAAKTPPAASAAPAKPSVAEVINNIKAGQDASVSLSNAGGAAVEELTPQMLADMPQEEFDEMVARLSPNKLRALLGG